MKQVKRLWFKLLSLLTSKQNKETFSECMDRATQKYNLCLLIASNYASNQSEFEELMDKARDMTLEEFNDYCYTSDTKC